MEVDKLELFYFGPDGWTSCGEKRAVANYVEYSNVPSEALYLLRNLSVANYVEYSNVPSEALYLLRNLSKGTEERPFTWQDGKMVFW